MNQEENILDDLLSDPRFRRWVTDGDHDDIWTKWMDKNPKNMEVMEDAIAIVRGLPVQKEKVTEEAIETSLQKLEMRAKLNDGLQRKSMRQTRRWLPYAAAVVALLLSVWIWNSNGSDRFEMEMSITTAPGEQKDVILPDSSFVVLNGNSSLQYYYNHNSGDRQVVLEGEAHFDVQKKVGENGQHPFVVKTQDINVAVLGTVFSVSADSIWTTIVLEEGTVLLTEGSNEKQQNEGLLMKPGEKAMYNKIKRAYTVENINAIEYNSWTQNHLSLDNRTAEEVARWIKRNYNIQIHIPDQYMDSSLTGSVNLEDLAIAVEVVALALGLEPVKSGDKQWDFKQIKTNE